MSFFEENVNDLYDRFEELLADSECDITASEFQGVIVGMQSAGLKKDNAHWLLQLSQLVSEEATLSETINQTAKQLFNETYESLTDDDMLAPILIPDDSYPMVDRLEALSLWSQGFLLGFGLQFGDKNELQKEIQESLTDIAEISQVNIENTEDEESNAGLETVIEHVKVAVKMIYMELVKKPNLMTSNTPPVTANNTLH